MSPEALEDVRIAVELATGAVDVEGDRHAMLLMRLRGPGWKRAYQGAGQDEPNDNAAMSTAALIDEDMGIFLVTSNAPLRRLSRLVKRPLSAR